MQTDLLKAKRKTNEGKGSFSHVAVKIQTDLYTKFKSTLRERGVDKTDFIIDCINWFIQGKIQ